MGKRRVLPSADPSKATNFELDKLDDIDAELDALESRRSEILGTIKSNFREVVVVFIDMVGSTKFKIDHENEPEVWIRRVRLFSEVVAAYINKLGGKVVKYIGDEVMAVFDGASFVNDAFGLVMRVDEMQDHLKQIIGVETKIKVAVDVGQVCFLEFEGHDQIDPQGTAIDRCARIGKYTEPGVVLCSAEFRAACPQGTQWTNAGSAAFKGIGETVIYQLGDKVTVDLSAKIEIGKDEYQRLKDRASRAERQLQELTVETQQLERMNVGLQEQLSGLDVDPKPEHSVTFEDEPEPSAWQAIEDDIAQLNRLIGSSPAHAKDHARFIFLDQLGEGDAYHSYERQFDECIQAKIVAVGVDGMFFLNDDNRLNQAIKDVTGSLNDKLESYERTDVDNEDLYEYSLDDPLFWQHKIGYHVL